MPAKSKKRLAQVNCDIVDKRSIPSAIDILESAKLNNVQSVRNFIYKMLELGLTPQQIVKRMLSTYLQEQVLTANKCFSILSILSKMAKARRPIYHLEHFVFKLVEKDDVC